MWHSPSADESGREGGREGKTEGEGVSRNPCHLFSRSLARCSKKGKHYLFCAHALEWKQHKRNPVALSLILNDRS